MSGVIKKDTHIQEAQDFVPGHLKTAVNFNKLIAIFVQLHQDLEDELDDLLNNVTDLTINAVGVQLDTIGIILNVDRNGEADAEYRIRLQGEAAKLAKSGEPETVIDAYKLVTVANRILLVEFSPATVELTAFVNDDDFTLTQDQAIIDTMQEVIAAGVGTSLQIQENPDNVFLFGDTADADANGDILIEQDHGLGDTADADANGDIAPGLGKGGKIARVLTGIQITRFHLTDLQWYAPFSEPVKTKSRPIVPSEFIPDSPFPFP